jgi:hypothetical protein
VVGGCVGVRQDAGRAIGLLPGEVPGQLCPGTL